VTARRAGARTGRGPGRGPRREARAGSGAEARDAAPEKLHKVLADLGLGSRREMERWIAAGRVEVNGARAQIGDRVGPRDRIRVDGVVCRRQPPRGATRAAARVLVMNKAEGIICTRRDPEGRPSCFDALPRLATGRWIAVGRLDINSSGLLLFTNDGALAHRMMHPSSGLTREYVVRVDAELDETVRATLTEGVLLVDGELARFERLELVGGRGRNHWYRVDLLEGRNREVRRLFESQGVRVSRLKRVRFGPVVLPSAVKRGRWQEMRPADVPALYRAIGMEAPRSARPSR
jgi:23S rRNA pseudouridine2605 synthase